MIKRLLILGSLDEFVRLIEMAKNKGIYTIVCDGYQDTPGKSHADKSYDISPGNTEEIARMCQEEKIEGIITSFSDYLFECMVKIADRAGLPCYLTPDRLKYYRDKNAMKEMLRDLQIASPRFASLSRGFEDSALAGFHFPVVIKPLDKYGSRGLKVLNSISEIRAAFDHTCETSDIKKILVEEYNDGYEFNMMTWVMDGTVHVISIADREKTSVSRGEIPISSRNVYPSRLMSYVYEDAKNLLQKVAGRMAQTDGPLSMQFFWKPDTGIQVCEIAGRFFGYEHELVEYSGGVSIEELLLAYVCGEATRLRALLQSHDPYFTVHSAALYFHGKEGMILCDQEKARLLALSEHAAESCFFYKEGTAITHFDKEPYAARYYITADSRKELDEKTDRIFRNISITDAVGREVIYRNQIGFYHLPL